MDKPLDYTKTTAIRYISHKQTGDSGTPSSQRRLRTGAEVADSHYSILLLSLLQRRQPAPHSPSITMAQMVLSNATSATPMTISGNFFFSCISSTPPTVTFCLGELVEVTPCAGTFAGSSLSASDKEGVTANVKRGYSTERAVGKPTVTGGSSGGNGSDRSR
jgi:hypothetical protein